MKTCKLDGKRLKPVHHWGREHIVASIAAEIGIFLKHLVKTDLSCKPEVAKKGKEVPYRWLTAKDLCILWNQDNLELFQVEQWL